MGSAGKSYAEFFLPRNVTVVELNRAPESKTNFFPFSMRFPTFQNRP